jgi:hypothetical protein
MRYPVFDFRLFKTADEAPVDEAAKAEALVAQMGGAAAGPSAGASAQPAAEMPPSAPEPAPESKEDPVQAIGNKLKGLLAASDDEGLAQEDQDLEDATEDLVEGAGDIEA